MEVVEEKLGYYANGVLRYKEQYTTDGKKHGEELGYYTNGNLYYKHQYLNGEQHGEQLGYHENGELFYKHQYLNGKEYSLIGYNINGLNINTRSFIRAKSEINYISGKRVSEEEWVSHKRSEKLKKIIDIKEFNIY